MAKAKRFRPSCSCSTTTECSTDESRLILGHGTRLGGFGDALGPPTRREDNSSIGCTGPMFGSNERHQSNKHRSMALRGRALFLAKRRTGSEACYGGMLN